METLDLDVLVVDDDATSCAMLAELLATWGARVRTAAGAAQAREAFEERVPDLLISDIGMLPEDGYALIRRLRERDGTRRVPAITVTACAGEAERAFALACGFDAVVAKPLDVAALRATVVQLAGTAGRAAAEAVTSGRWDS